MMWVCVVGQNKYTHIVNCIKFAEWHNYENSSFESDLV